MSEELFLGARDPAPVEHEGVVAVTPSVRKNVQSPHARTMVTVTATRCNPIGSRRLTTTHATNARSNTWIPDVSSQNTPIDSLIELPRRANRDDHQGDGTQPVDRSARG